MRRVFVLPLMLVLSLLLIGAQIEPRPRGCPGTTIGGEEPCCISGMILLGGRAVEGAEVTIRRSAVSRPAYDVTGYVEGDPFPTYGVALSGEPLVAEPGEVLTLSASYGKWKRTVQFTVVHGELVLDVELKANASGAAQ